MTKKRVVVTGLGCLTPIGCNKDDFWKSLLEGKSGAKTIDFLDVDKLPVKFSASVKDFQSDKYFDKKDLKKMDLFMQYGMAAGIDAVADAKLLESQCNPDRIGVSIGSGIGGLYNIENTRDTFIKSGSRRISPFFVPASIINMISGNLSIKYGFKGPNLSIVTACTTGTHNIGEGFRQIQYSHADVMICGGAEMATSDLGVGGFAAARALSTRNDSPETASRPWDKDRDGFVLGDGAGVIVLEELEHAKKRGAKIYAEINGYGMSADAYHMTLPSETGEGASRCMTLALEDANLDPSNIDYINAHGTSTQQNDINETNAIKKVFGDHSSKLLVSSTKSITGHLLGAAGGLEAGIASLALHEGCVPPTINLDNPQEGCDLNYVPHTTVEEKINIAVSNSFGFGGTNCTLIFKKFEE